MKKRKILIFFSALVIGGLIAFIAFYLLQSSRKIKATDIKTITVSNASPTPSSNLFLTIDSPQDETVVSDRNIKISGKTIPGAKIVIVTPTTEEAAVPIKDGSFSTDINLSQDENIIEISAIAPNGEVVKVRRIVSYSTESF